MFQADSLAITHPLKEARQTLITKNDRGYSAPRTHVLRCTVYIHKLSHAAPMSPTRPPRGALVTASVILLIIQQSSSPSMPYANSAINLKPSSAQLGAWTTLGRARINVGLFPSAALLSPAETKWQKLRRARTPQRCCRSHQPPPGGGSMSFCVSTTESSVSERH